jgi:hypothetical protein
MILTQHQESCRRIQDATRRAMQASLERTICQDLNKLLPRVSMSGDDINGEIMRHAKAFAQWPEYQEWVKRNPQRKKYVKQAINMLASRVLPTNEESWHFQLTLWLVGWDVLVTRHPTMLSLFMKGWSDSREGQHHHVLPSQFKREPLLIHSKFFLPCQ